MLTFDILNSSEASIDALKKTQTSCVINVITTFAPRGEKYYGYNKEKVGTK
jgi:hypothetical protein